MLSLNLGRQSSFLLVGDERSCDRLATTHDSRSRWSLIHETFGRVGAFVRSTAPVNEGHSGDRVNFLVEVVILDELGEGLWRGLGFALRSPQLIHLLMQVLDRVRSFHLACLSPLGFLSGLDVVLDKDLNLLLRALQIVIKLWDAHTKLGDSLL